MKLTPLQCLRCMQTSTKLRLKQSTCSLSSSSRPPDATSKLSQASAENLDTLFDTFKTIDTGLVSSVQFLSALSTTGLRSSDPRLREFTANLDRHRTETCGNTDACRETQHLDRNTFKTVVAPNVQLISRALRRKLVIPDFDEFTHDVTSIYGECDGETKGTVASYIPQLVTVSPDLWGVGVCTVDGQRFSVGDVDVPFTVQSCSKPVTYGIALETLGQGVVHGHVGQEPSGRNFNELILDHNKRPHNPMINAGAIMVIALLKVLIHPGMTPSEKYAFIAGYFGRMSGGEYLGFNKAVYESECESGDRNYALGHYMREHKCFPQPQDDLKGVLELYFQSCSMEMNCESMSVIAATLANGGICPITNEKILKPAVVRDVLSLMHSCGMYDYSGQFAFSVGLPAKSGVSGCLYLVVPNVMGVCLYSPPLDTLGNSYRGIKFCRKFVSVFNLHTYDNWFHLTGKKDPRCQKYERKGGAVAKLLYSAAGGNVVALRTLWTSGADMSAADYDGRTALHLSAAEGHLPCVVFLLERCGVPRDPVDRWGHLPADEAQRFGHREVEQFIRGWGAGGGK